MTLKNANSTVATAHKGVGGKRQRNNRWFGEGLSSVGVVGI
jgi:hypothetical protein